MGASRVVLWHKLEMTQGITPLSDTSDPQIRDGLIQRLDLPYVQSGSNTATTVYSVR